MVTSVKHNYQIPDETTYILSSPGREASDEGGHVSDDVRRKRQVEQHVEDVVDHLALVDGVEVAIAHGGERGDGPVHGHDVARPQRLLSEIRKHGSYPCLVLFAPRVTRR